MGLFGGNSGTVGPTPQEQALTANMWSQWRDYQTRWLPVQQHLADVVNDMAQPQAWQRQEAEGKASVDVASAFQQREQQQTASLMTRGINPGSPAFKLGISAGATAEAATKGAKVSEANQAIDRAYIENLKAITNAGQKLAGSSVQGQGISAEVGSREAISNAQVTNENTAGIIASAGLGLSALASPQGMSAMGDLGRSWGINPAPITDMSTPSVSTPTITNQPGGITTSWLR